MAFWDWLFRRKDEPNQFQMTETMWGYVAHGAEKFEEGYEKGKREGNRLEYEVTLTVDNFKEFKAPSGRKAPMTGWVTCKNLFGEKLLITGEYGLYSVDPRTGQRRITYTFDFTGKDGKDYRLSGYKVIVHERGTLDLLEDQTTLFAEISRLGGSADAVVARGIIHYHVEDFADMLFSIRTPDNDTIENRLVMANKFFSFVSKEISGYFREINPFYTAEYSNLVTAGTSKANGRDVEFFFFSGAHDKGFPWGDNVSFWDIGLVLREGNVWKRFALSEYAIENLKLRLSEGEYEYVGPIYEIRSGYQVSFGEMHQPELPPHIRVTPAKISLRFRPKVVEIKNLPFELDMGRLDDSCKDLRKRIEKSKLLDDIERRRGDLTELGYRTEIHRLADLEGELTIDGTRYVIDTKRCLGEGEFGRIAAMRMPALYYNYFCAIEPEADAFRVQVRSGVLRTLSADVLAGEAEEIVGQVIGQTSRTDVLIKGEQKEDIESARADGLITPTEDLLEINNDHFPTAIFQRRIVVLPGAVGTRSLALEEDMSRISTEPVNSDQVSTVAAIRDPDRFRALDRVLDATNFFDLLDKAQKASGKSKEQFSILVKPNFSFMYSLTDITTFTDPRLVEHLIDRIYDRGYRNIAVVEAQSTYTVFVTNRDVPTLARYIGLRGKNYKIIDLSVGTEPYDYGGTLGLHKVHPAWKDADFRISFAKNKTHAYAFYTLTIKNIYGALPEENKFKAYHCDKQMGIFAPTIDYIDKFPIHFGLIDAYFSADGPFGIFADREPNFTGTVIGGDNIVAVDWVGASKMGYDPMISEYMQMAVERFGKPKIRMMGDQTTYPGWRNVSPIISQAAFAIMDRDFLLGDFLYSVMVAMDPFFEFKCDEASRKVLRALSTPVRKVLFDWVRGMSGPVTRDNLRRLLDPKEWEYLESVLKSAFE